MNLIYHKHNQFYNRVKLKNIIKKHKINYLTNKV